MKELLLFATLSCLVMPNFYCTKGSIEDVSHTTTEVTLATEDQVTLKGTYYSAAKPGPGILLLHMCLDGADRSSWSGVATRLAGEGFHVLAFDFRGYGQSDGEWPAFQTMPEFIEVCRNTVMKDVEAAYQFLQSQQDVAKDSIGLAGASCGVFMGIDAAHNHPEIRALALLSGPFDEQARANLETLDKVPVLSAASEDDARAFEAMKRVFAATKHPNSTLVQYKGDAHGTNMFIKQPDLERAIVEWFKRWL